MISLYWSLKLSDYGLNDVLDELTIANVLETHPPTVDCMFDLGTGTHARALRSTHAHGTRTDHEPAFTDGAVPGNNVGRCVRGRLCHVSDTVSTAVDCRRTTVAG
jgi:hypothetical protein